MITILASIVGAFAYALVGFTVYHTYFKRQVVKCPYCKMTRKELFDRLGHIPEHDHQISSFWPGAIWPVFGLGFLGYLIGRFLLAVIVHILNVPNSMGKRLADWIA